MRRASAERCPRPDAVVRDAVVRFAVSSLVVLVVVVVAAWILADRSARARALDDAQSRGVNLANRLAAPLVDADVRAGAPGAADALETVMANRMNDGSLVRVKIWAEDGTVVWSDEPSLVGRVLELEPDVESLFGTRGSVAEISDLDRPENVAEVSSRRLLEVYAGAFDADGQPVVVESYFPLEEMRSDARAITVRFVPLVVGALVVLLLALLPLALSLARRVQRAQRERALMLHHLSLASRLERRRLAEELHEEVIPDLAGLGYVLPSVVRDLDRSTDPRTAAVLDEALAVVHRDVSRLRSIMVGVYPPDLEDEASLREALATLVGTQAHEAGLASEVTVQAGQLTPAAASLAYRVVREALRNVIKHARATTVWVEVTRRGDLASVVVADDGVGVGDGPVESPEGHLGVRLLRDTLVDSGGELEIAPAQQGGTRLVALLPADLATGTDVR